VDRAIGKMIFLEAKAKERVRLASLEIKPSRSWASPNNWQELQLELKFNSQRELSDAVAAGVTDPRGETLSECALAVNTLSQIVAGIIEV
jgi:hypothetical protein